MAQTMLENLTSKDYSIGVLRRRRLRGVKQELEISGSRDWEFVILNRLRSLLENANGDDDLDESKAH
jgi:hypothetical protein